MSHLLHRAFIEKAETREIVDEVVTQTFDSVCSTMGPDGKYVVINNLGRPRVTKDGVSVAKALDFAHPQKNLIANLIKEPSIKTDVEVGDGTTTTVFMMYHLYQSFKHHMTFANTRFLDMLVKQTHSILGDLVIPGDINDELFRKMLMTSSNYEDEIVDGVLEIYKKYEAPNIKLMKYPSITGVDIRETKEIVFPGRFGKDAYQNKNHPDGTWTITGDQTPVLVVDGMIQQLDTAVLAEIFKSTKVLVLIARNIEPMALTGIEVFMQREGVVILPYNMDVGGSLATDVMQELADVLGVTMVSSPALVSDKIDMVPKTSFKITRTGIEFDAGDDHVSAVAEKIIERLAPRYEKMNLVERQSPVALSIATRLGRLRANNIEIRVGGTVPSEAEERYYRYEDAVRAAKTGLQFGILPGIGWGYLTASQTLLGMKEQLVKTEEQEMLFDLFLTVLRAQYIHLTKNEDFNNPVFVDLVTGESDVGKPSAVFDNAAATMVALVGGWSTAKTLAKLNNIMGREATAY